MAITDTGTFPALALAHAGRPRAVDRPTTLALTDQIIRPAVVAGGCAITGLVIIDPAVPQYEQLAAGLHSGLDLVVLDPGLAAIPQISAALSQRKDLHSLHLVGHGQPGQLHLADSVLDAAIVEQQASDLHHWQKAFRPDAELLLYGCEAGAGPAGAALIHSLARLTGLGIAASTTRIGNAELGGDWEFDCFTRPMGAPSAFTAETQKAYRSVFASLINGLGGPAGFGENSLGRNDDSSSNFINLTSVFEGGLNFFGIVYNGFYVNNNGHITFTSASSTFSPFQIGGIAEQPIIIPFITDIDTRFGPVIPSPGGTSTGSNLVYWDLDPARDTVTITWDDVGEYSLGNVPNAFQLRLLDLGFGNFSIEMRYEDISWHRGNARGGYSANDGENFYELPQSGTIAMLDLEANSNVGDPGVYVFSVSNGPSGPSVSSTTPNGTYGASALINLTVRFSEAVFVSGNPRLQLETGGTDRFATFTGGSGTDTLSFAYTVQIGDSSADLDVLSSAALTLNGGTIRDAAGNNALLTLAAPGSPASLAAKKNLVIAGGPPVITAVPAALTATSFSLTTNVATTAALQKADNSLFFSTTLPSRSSTPLSVAAQAAVTAISLIVTDLAGQRTTSDTAVVLGTNNADQITGTANPSIIFGFDGIDILTSGDAVDALAGGDGNDFYNIETSGDLVAESNPVAATGGVDTVRTTLANTTLTDNVENLTLTGFGAINGTGNSLNNIITGNSVTNILTGGGGIDTLIGGDGNDFYNIETSGDLVVENNDNLFTSGSDTVRSSLATYTLAANVENLILTGSGAINGTGNALNNRLTGNSVANLLIGADGSDLISAAAGNDTLIGGDGNDTLTGGLGSDIFRMDSPLNPTTNRDRITDFSLDQFDLIALDSSVFTTLTTTGTLDPTAFFSGDSATTAAHRILYDSATGLLAYDADGTGAAAAIAFATLTPGLALTNASFTVT